MEVASTEAAFGALDVLFENATVALGLFDGALQPVRLNPRFRASGPDLVSATEEHARRALDRGAPVIGVHLEVAGRLLACDFHPMPPGLDGRAMGVAIVATDLTEETRATASLAASEARLRQVLDAVSAFAVVLDREGVVMEANAQALGAAGLTPSDVAGRKLRDAYWFNHEHEAQARLDEALAKARGGEATAYREKLRVGPDTSLTMDLQVAPIRDTTGNVFQIVASAIDVTTLAAAQDAQALLTAELNHRVKNILAVVRALVAQTARRAPTKEALAQALEGRIAAMARSVALVSRAQWSGFGLADVLYEQIEAYGSDRFRIDGPNFAVTPKAALGLALITYELVTNASKYGALSAAGGRVDVTWRVDNGEVLWSWIERGGPKVSPPKETGFGSLLVQSVAEGDLGGALTVDYGRDGVHVALKTKLSALQGGKTDDGAGRGKSPLSGARVLVVEDSAIIALEVASILEAAGATIVGPAPSVAEGLTLAGKEKIDVAMLDLDLGGHSSAPVREALKKKRVPVLTVAAVPAGLAPTDSPMLPKPFTDQDLLSALTALLAPAQSSV